MNFILGSLFTFYEAPSKRKKELFTLFSISRREADFTQREDKFRCIKSNRSGHWCRFIPVMVLMHWQYHSKIVKTRLIISSKHISNVANYCDVASTNCSCVLSVLKKLFKNKRKKLKSIAAETSRNAPYIPIRREQ